MQTGNGLDQRQAQPAARRRTAAIETVEAVENLAALGFGPGPADGQFGWSTEVAIERWQQAHGMTVTGSIPLGAVAFLPGPLRVTSVAQPLGATVAAGTSCRMRAASGAKACTPLRATA